jgi:hypothetical protein
MSMDPLDLRPSGHSQIDEAVNAAGDVVGYFVDGCTELFTKLEDALAWRDRHSAARRSSQTEDQRGRCR